MGIYEKLKEWVTILALKIAALERDAMTPAQVNSLIGAVSPAVPPGSNVVAAAIAGANAAVFAVTYNPTTPGDWTSSAAYPAWAPGDIQSALDTAAGFFPRQVPQEVFVSASGMGSDIAAPYEGTLNRPYATLAAAKAFLWPTGGIPQNVADYNKPRTIHIIGNGTITENLTLPTGLVNIVADGFVSLNGLVTMLPKLSEQYGSANIPHYNFTGITPREGTGLQSFGIGGGTTALQLTHTVADVPVMVYVQLQNVRMNGSTVATSLGDTTLTIVNAQMRIINVWDTVTVTGGTVNATNAVMASAITMTYMGLWNGCTFSGGGAIRQRTSTGASFIVGIRNCGFSSAATWTVDDSTTLPMDATSYDAFVRAGRTIPTGALRLIDNDTSSSGIDATTGTTTIASGGAMTPFLRVDAGAALAVTIISPTAQVALINFSGNYVNTALGGIQMQLYVDGVAVPTTQGSVIQHDQSAGLYSSVSMAARVPVAAGSHTYSVQWLSNGAGNTARFAVPGVVLRVSTQLR